MRRHSAGNQNELMADTSKILGSVLGTQGLTAAQLSQRAAVVASCLAYCACSLSMVLANKVVLSGYGLKQPVALLSFQAACSAAVLAIFRQLKFIKFESLEMEKAKAWLPVNVLFCAMLFTGFKSLEALAVPMVTIFKNLTNIVILFGDWYLFGQLVSSKIVASLSVIVVGALLAGWADLAFSWSGYAWMLANCGSTAGYVLYMKFAMKGTKLSKFGMAYYNNVLATPMTLVLALVLGQVGDFLTLPAWRSAFFCVTMVTGGTLGMVLNLASLWCVQTTSPSTYAMVGALNKIPLAFLGVVLFHEPVTWQLACFITLALTGGIMYSYYKSQEAQASKNDPTPKDTGGSVSVKIVGGSSGSDPKA